MTLLITGGIAIACVFLMGLFARLIVRSKQLDVITRDPSLFCDHSSPRVYEPDWAALNAMRQRRDAERKERFGARGQDGEIAGRRTASKLERVR